MQVTSCAKHRSLPAVLSSGLNTNHFNLRVSGTRSLVVGNGLDKNSNQGPLINEKAVKKVERHLSESVKQGARVICGGNRLDSLGGTFFEPTVLADVTNEMPVSREETFGPVVPLLKYVIVICFYFNLYQSNYVIERFLFLDSKMKPKQLQWQMQRALAWQVA